MEDPEPYKQHKITSELMILVRAKETKYPDFVRIYIPRAPYVKRMEGYEPKAKSQKPKITNDDPYETPAEASLRRTRKAIKDYALCNDFDQFATFTFKADRQNVAGSKSKMANWLKNQRNRNGKFRYLIVAEFHKDGESLHFHALIGGYKGKLRPAINPHTGKPIKQKGGKAVYEYPEYKSGFSNVKKLNGNLDTKTKVAYYIQKYITKDMPIFANKNRYWVSKNLNKPVTKENPEQWYRHVPPDRHYMNDYGTFLEFDRGHHPLVDIFMESDD